MAGRTEDPEPGSEERQDSAPRVIGDILSRIDALEEDLEDLFERRRADLAYRLEKRRVVFTEDVKARHRALRVRLGEFLRHARPMTIVTAPVIYAMIVPVAFLDLSVTLYQHICFRAYGIARVKRSGHVVIDRHQLAYLNALEKLNCVYCGYANGVFAYARDVAARTEQYWCPIKHASRVRHHHQRYRAFADYGDGEHYRQRLEELRAALREE